MNNNPNNRQPRQGYPRPRPTPPGGPGRQGSGAPTGGGYRRTPEMPRDSYRRPPIRGYRPSKRRNTEDYMLWFLVVAVVLLVALIITFIVIKSAKSPTGDSLPSESQPSIPAGPASPSESTPTVPDNPDTPATLPDWKAKPSNMKGFIPKTSSSTVVAEGLNSEYAILVELAGNSVIASKKADERMYPASMTKVMTVIVACENISDMWDTFTITTDIRWPLDNTGASMAYFELGEPIYLIDLIYGAWLPSGADATTALAVKIAGSEAAFVQLMNEKAKELGCDNTHFTNTTGLHDEDHYSTARDMATIMAYAVQNPLIKQVMCAKTYDTYADLEKVENRLYATWNNTLVNMSGDYSFFKGGKTGYEDAAGSCMVSLIKDTSGKEYVVVTGKASYSSSYSGRENTFRDVKTLYESYVK